MTKHEREFDGGLPMLCSVKRVARELDSSKSKIYKMIEDGKIPTVLIDGMVRVRREVVEALCQITQSSGSESTEASTSPSEDTGLTSDGIRSVSRLARLTRPRRSARSAT